MDIFVNTILEGLKTAIFWLDSIVYNLIGIVYNLFVDIANTTVFTDEIINIFAEKVYALLGVFMLFKVSFSIMTYIINPDEFTDKTKGFSKLISNIVITLALLLATPWLFSQAMDIQRIILKDNIIGKIFATSETSSVSSLDAGDTMAYETFKAFYYLDTEKYSNCEEIYKSENVEACKKDFPNYEKYSDVFYISGLTHNIDVYTDFELLNEKASDGEYIMNYLPVISTIAGGFICWILIVFCFDVAVRSIKLGFLRMIAPVPIISRIDPKKGKDVFDKWLKSCVSTYLDLFIRLLAIYFAIFVIGQVVNMQFKDAVTGDDATVNAFVKVFIIMGALLFAKQLPQLITELTGIKMNGKFTLNPLKKVAEVPLVGQTASRIGGAAGSMLTGNGFKAGWRAGGKAVPLLGGDGKQSIAAGFNRYNRFGEDGKKRSEENQKYELGEKLFKEYGEKASGTASIYKGAYAEKYAQSAKLMNDAKDRRNELEGDYKQLEMFFNTNKDKMSTEEQNEYIKLIDKARVDAAKAASDYDKLKTSHNYLRSQDSVNAAREDAYLAAEDRHTAADKVSGYSRSNYDFNVLASKLSAQNSTSNNNLNNDSTTTHNAIFEKVRENHEGELANSSTQPERTNTFINVNEEVTENSQRSYDELATREQETRTIVENLEPQFQRKQSEYQNSVANASIPEAKRAQIAREYEEIQQTREEAIFEHERVSDELNSVSNQVEDSTTQEDVGTETYQRQYDKLVTREQETRKIAENLEPQFQRKQSEYQNSVANASVPEAKRAQIAKEFTEMKQAREQAIFEHERALDELNNASNQANNDSEQ